MATGDTNTKNKLINLANVEFTENGLYVPNKGVTGFGKVKVTVPPDAMKKPLYITPSATDNISVPTWDEYSGPYIDNYVKPIGYRKENRNVYDFYNNYIGKASAEGVITDSEQKIIGKVSNYNPVYNVEEDHIIGYSDSRNFAYDLEDTKIGTVTPDNLVIDSEEHVIGKRYTSEYLAYNNADMEYVGVRDVKVRKISSWIDSEISADNIRQGHTILGVTGHVIELQGEERTANSSTSTQVLTPSNGKNGITKVTINPYTLEQKTVTPQFNTQNVTPSSGYNGLSRVTVNPIDVEIIVEKEPQLAPENIKKNVRLFGGQIVGTYDNYVAPVVQGISISPSIENKNYTPPTGVDGFNKVSVSAVTSAIDPNIKPENIRRGITILGTLGEFVVEKLQEKTVDPRPYEQVVTFDSEKADGLKSVTVTAVTSGIDSNIQPNNIKKDVTILGVTGDFDPQPIIQPTVTVTPTTLNQSVTPNPGYDGLGRVDINAVTSSIDPNILAENIKKNIDILGVTGTYDPKPNYQAEKIVQPVTAGDVEVSADPTYDALLKVIVKAVTASIDPNIMPKNIRKNISILGVLGTMEEGGEQKWFDFSGMQNFVELNQDAWSEGGNETIRITTGENDYELENFINETFPGVGNINAVMFTEVYGYNDEEITDDIVEECYIKFIGGTLYQDYSHITTIPDQIRYFYPYVNDYGINGLTFGLDYDDGSARVMKLYVLTNSNKNHNPVPVLVNGDMTSEYLPSEFDGFRYVKDINIPAHNVFIPKVNDKDDKQWVLRDEDTITTKIVEVFGEPDNIQASAYDRNYGTTDEETDIIGAYKLKNSSKLLFNQQTFVATQSTSGTTGYIMIPGNVEKQSGYYYYFRIDPNIMSGYSQYYTVAACNALFVIYLYRYSSYGYYHLGWRYNWSSSTAGNATYYNYYLYPGNTYWIRVYVSGSTARLDFSTDGVNWTNNVNTVSSGYINPTNTNPIYIYSSAGPNTKLYTKNCYITDSVGNIVYNTTEEVYIKQTGHEIVPSIRDMLLVNRDQTRIKIGSNGNETVRYSSYNHSNKLLDLNTNGYIQIPNVFNITGKTWEICQHIKLPPVTSSSDRYLACFYANQSNNYWNRLLVNTNGTMYWEGWYSSGSRYVEGTLGGSNLVVGNDYYIRHGWNGSTWYCQVSRYADFSSFIVNWTSNSSSSTYTSGSTLVLGNSVDKGSNTSIRYLYLDDSTYVKVNGQIVWTGYDSYSLRGNLVNYIDDGSATTLDAYLAGSNLHGKIVSADITGDVSIDIDGVASGFSVSNYITFSKDIPAISSFEQVLKVKTSDVTTLQVPSAGDPYKGLGTFLITASSKMELYASSDGISNNISNGNTSSESLLAYTTYYIKYSWDGTHYKVSVSTDGISYTDYITVNNTNPPAFNGKVGIGTDTGASNSNPFLGTIDLSKSYIKINNEIWWQPNIVTSYDYDWIFTQDPNWSYTGLTNLGKKGELVVPEHNVYTWNQSKQQWDGTKQLTLNVNDPDAILYTEIVESE